MKFKKSTLLGALALFSFLVLTSCGNTSTNNKTSSGNQTSTTIVEEEVTGILTMVDDNSIYFDNQLASTETIKLKIDGKDAVIGNNAFTAASEIKFEGTSENKLYIYIVGMTKDGNKESYTFQASRGLNASTDDGMNVGTRKLNLMKNNTKIFISVATQDDGWNKTLSIKLNDYIEKSRQGSF